MFHNIRMAKNAPCGFMNPQGAFLYSYRLSAVFFLPAENGCRGESRARRQHERNPESGIAVIASLWGIFPRRLLSILDSIAAAIGRSRRLFVLAGISTASFS